MHNKRVKRVCNNRRALPGNALSRGGPLLGKPLRPRMGKTRGQAMVIVALAMFVLIGLVGLAVDGGSMYLQRRTAQNATDGAALAGTSTMLFAYQGMLYDNSSTVTDGDDKTEDYILKVIEEYATANGVKADTVVAYFVNDNKQVVSATKGWDDDGKLICGTAAGQSACRVGQNGGVPWTRGVKGITVLGRAETDAFFMSLFGWKKITAEANATAFMGPALVTGQDVTLLPIGFYTTTEYLRQMRVGQLYTLISGNLRKIPTPLDPEMVWDISGNWGYVDFNEQGEPPPVTKAWITCGFNPKAVTLDIWDDFCNDPKYEKESRAIGPTHYWTGAGSAPDAGVFTAPRVEWKGVDGLGPDWWLKGSSGVTGSCRYFKDLVEQLVDPVYMVPVFDRWTGSGNNTHFHLLTLAQFRFLKDDISCQSPRQEWAIRGYFEYAYSAGTSGSHGDLVHSSVHTVFLEP